MRLSRVSTLLTWTLLLGVAACSGNTSDDDAHEGAQPDDDCNVPACVSAEVRSICSKDRDVFERCGYTKFETRADCERAFGDIGDAERAPAHEYYDCLATCAGPGPEFDAILEQCSAIVDGRDVARAPCEMLCNGLAAASCTASPAVDTCLPNCFKTYGACPTEVAALARCSQTFDCRPDGSPYSTGCDAENAAVSNCYNSMP